MKLKVLSHFINVQYPERKIEIILGKEMAQRYVDRFCKHDPDFLRDFINGHENNGLFMSNGTSYLMCLPKKFDHGTVYHEVFHACTRIWYDAGAHLKFPQNDEVVTYMQGVLVKQIEEIYNAYKE